MRHLPHASGANLAFRCAFGRIGFLARFWLGDFAAGAIDGPAPPGLAGGGYCVNLAQSLGGSVLPGQAIWRSARYQPLGLDGKWIGVRNEEFGSFDTTMEIKKMPVLRNAILAAACAAGLAVAATPAPAETTLRAVMHSDLKILDP